MSADPTETTAAATTAATTAKTAVTPAATPAATSKLGIVIETLGVFAFFAVATAYIYWPATERMRGSIFDTPIGTRSDGFLIQWILAWDCHALWNAPLRLFDGNIFYPAVNTLAGSEHMFGHLPLFATVYALYGSPVMALQFTRLATVALCGVSMYALLRHWSAGRAAALFAGFVYAFCPARYLTIHMLQLVAMPYLPLVIIYIDRVLDRGRIRDVGIMAIALTLQLLSSFYLAYIAAVAVGLYLVTVFIYRRWRRRKSHWVATLAGLTLALSAMAATAVPYLGQASEGVISDHSQEALAGFSATPWSTYTTRPQFKRFVQTGRSYVGILPALLCLAALLGVWRDRASRFPVVAALVLCIGMYLMALGPFIVIGGHEISLPYAWASAIIPGFSAMRVPVRFTLGFVAGWSVLAGLGLQSVLSATRLSASRPAAAALALGCILLTAADFGHFSYQAWLRPIPIPGRMPEVYERLKEFEPGPLLEIPTAIQGEDGFVGLDREAFYQYMSIYHWRPLLNGYTGYPPPSAAIVKRIARVLPSERALTLLRRMTGLRYIIVHLDKLEETAGVPWRRAPGLSLLADLGQDLLFEVVDSGPSDLLAAVVAGPPPGSTLMGNEARVLAADGRRAGIQVVAFNLDSDLVYEGLSLPIQLRVSNRSLSTWPVLTERDDSRVEIAYEWTSATGVAESGRLRLPYDLESGENVILSTVIAAPKQPGTYRLEMFVAQGEYRFPDSVSVEGLTVREWTGGATAPSPPQGAAAPSVGD